MDWTTLLILAAFFGGSLLYALGQRLGWPLLVLLADWIKRLGDKDGDGKPDLPPAAPAPVPASDVKTLVSDALPGQPVAFDFGLVLTLLLPLVWQLVKEMVEKFVLANGRQPTADEQRAFVSEAVALIESGRVHVTLPPAE